MPMTLPANDLLSIKNGDKVLCKQDNTVHQLLDRDGMLTVGTDAKDIDWEAMWRDELDHDDRDPAEDGVISAPCSHHYDSAGTLPVPTTM